MGVRINSPGLALKKNADYFTFGLVPSATYRYCWLFRWIFVYCSICTYSIQCSGQLLKRYGSETFTLNTPRWMGFAGGFGHGEEKMFSPSLLGKPVGKSTVRGPIFRPSWGMQFYIYWTVQYIHDWPFTPPSSLFLSFIDGKFIFFYISTDYVN